MADSAVQRLRGILAATMTRTAIDQLIGDVLAELATVEQPIPYQLADVAEPAPVPPWTDVSTWNYQARMCTTCGWETRWNVAQAMERHLAEQHPTTVTFTRADGTVVQPSRWLAIDPSALADAVLPEVAGG